MNREKFYEEMVKNTERDLSISRAKNNDYADGEDAFQNFRGVEHFGICSVEEGIVVRVSDKMQRISNLLKRDASVKDESIVDTLSDARNYLNILQVWLENKRKGGVL
jgi:hypothetical protein